jgi:TRAP-type C4-dicarboxylate transport system substrate-binding protein
MRIARASGLCWLLLAAMAMAQPIAAAPDDPAPLRLMVVAPSDQDHLAWAGATRLQQTARANGLELSVERAALTESTDFQPDLLVMPVRSLASRVPPLEVLELPFLYPSTSAVHAALDGALGGFLKEEARRDGWEIVAFWDEGLHIFSGIKRYDRARNLRIREFLITRPDPVAEKQFRYWKAYARRISPEDRGAVLRECLIASRAATPQEIVREQLYRVHLSMSLSNHRYEGWVVISPVERWSELDSGTRKILSTALRDTTAWQRNDAQEREAAALAVLRQHGMSIYEVDAEEREAFLQPLPEYAELLSDDIDPQKKRMLIELASVGAAAVAGTGAGAATVPGTGAGDAASGSGTGAAAAPEPGRNPAPGAEAREGN